MSFIFQASFPAKNKPFSRSPSCPATRLLLTQKFLLQCFKQLVQLVAELLISCLAPALTKRNCPAGEK